LKQFFARLITNWKLVILPALIKMGFWGVVAVSILDSSSLPVPMDAVMAVYIWGDKAHFWAYVLLAAAGSAIGGLVPFGIGRAGGELFLLKRVNRARYEALRARFEKQEFLAVMIPSMLPPPTPWKIFVFAAGVFEMRVLPYMLAVFAGRIVRWTVLAFLVMELGPGAADLVAHHAMMTLAVVGGLALVGFSWWWLSKRRTGELQDE
jgi:membrane protein YqaA with SNARE-associated domain